MFDNHQCKSRLLMKEKHETTSSDNCDMVNDRSANESLTAVNRLTVIEISTVNNQLSNHSKPV